MYYYMPVLPTYVI